MEQYLHGRKSIFGSTLGGNSDTRQAELKDVAGLSHVHLANKVVVLRHLFELCNHRVGGFVDLAKKIVDAEPLETVDQVLNL